MRTQIFVMTHKKFNPPQDPVYVPLHVGRALGQDLGYMGDDEGDSISELNPYYGELTGLYWLWKNYHDVDIIGVCHYRRYFFNTAHKLMTQEEYEAGLQDADIMVSNPMSAPGTYLEYFGLAHNMNDMLLAGEIIEELFPEDYAAFEQVMQGSKYYFGNLCVMRKQIFDAYCNWLFSIFFEMEKRIDVSSYDDYHKRIFGFLSEELLLVYITARKLRVKEGNIGITAEKAETVEFKRAMGQLVKMGQFKEARQLFYDFLRIRPDVQLELSDIKNEIPDIELILFILEKEAEQGIAGFYEVSHELPLLIQHLRRIREILMHDKAGKTIEESEQQYLESHLVSDIAKSVIYANI
ncbi:MAG: DUF4422 domain-containing protein [Roseburia sp.]